MKVSNQIITIEARNVYGNTLYYVTSDHAPYIAQLVRKKTVDLRDVQNLEALGLECFMAGKAEVNALEYMQNN